MRHLARDKQLRLLMQFAREDRCGMDDTITPERRERLILAERAAFDKRLAAFPAVNAPNCSTALSRSLAQNPIASLGASTSRL